MDWDEYHGFLRPMTDEEKRVREGGIMDEVLAQAERDAETAEELFWTGGARRIRALAAEVRALRAKVAQYENHPRDETEREIDIIIAAMASRGEDA